ncbi:MAG: HAD family hydrolase [Sphaerobacter sp.]|nr:HAD family hydrolase [Sphaerobacter sp.]
MATSGLRPKLVLFDLDDTLCDHQASLRLRLRIAFEAACRGLPGIDLDALVEASVQRAVFGTDHFAEVLALAGVRDQARVEQAVASYVSDRYRGLRLFDEALEVVEAVRQYARVGLITNGPSEIQRSKIARLQIAHIFPFILVSEEVGVWKPDPAIFHRALALGEAAPHEAVYVGDNPEHDVAGAQRAGLISVWVNRTGRDWPGGPPPDYVVGNLRELLPLFGFGPVAGHGPG